MSQTAPRKSRFEIERLEEREVPAAGGWLVQPFQHGPAAGLPSDWRQWSNLDEGQQAFTVDRAGFGLGDQGRLVSEGGSATTARAWANTPFAADVEASAAVLLSSLNPAQVFVRGQNPAGNTPTYYAASVVRGAELQLVRVVNGTASVLGSVKSADWISNQWVTIKIRAEGDQLKAFLYRGDTNQYLSAAGVWTRQPVAAIDRVDTAIRGGGVVGVARPAAVAGQVFVDSVRVGSPGEGPDAPLREERFTDGHLNGVPPGWSQWVGGGQLQTGTRADETLRLDGTSTAQARVWMTQPVSTDVQVSSSVFVDSLVPAGVFARGSSVNGSTPTFYALTINRGLTVELTRVVNGASTSLGRITTNGWQSGLWVQMSLVAKGNQLRVQVYRSDTGQYLSDDGSWGLTPAWAISRTDDAIRSGGLAGLSRGTGAAGELSFDNFLVTAAPADMNRAGTIPTESDKSSTVTSPTVPPPPQPVVTSPPPPPVVTSPPPVVTSPPPVPTSPPPVTNPTTPPVVTSPTNPKLPVVQQNMSWIRIAQLAYHGTPMTEFEKNLLRSSVDLVIPNLQFVDQIDALNANTPQLIYTNISNVYLSLLTDWLAYADRMGYDRESAFYHVNQATPFQGLSASATTVDQFWGVYRGSDATGWTNLTRDARIPANGTALAAAGESLAVGYTEKFREINIALKTPPAGNWQGVLEYVQAVDANGRPTRWGSMPILSDSTNGFRASGEFVFDPPKDWVASSVNSSARLFYVRFRTAVGGTAPVVSSILSHDYTDFANQRGTIPAFDYTADRDGDGYLTDAEYARRKRGFDARFEYESRLTFPYYGPNRFATNPAAPEFRAWAVDYHQRVLASQPKVDGFFLDNSTGRLAVDPAGLVEPLVNYGDQYGTLVAGVNAALGSKWILSNTVGGGTSVDAQIGGGVSYLEEFAIRPMSANTVQFEDMAAMVRYRRQLSGGTGYEVLDSLPTNGVDAADPRFLMSTLTMYYMFADPTLSFLMINGGNEPASSWTRHWTDAINYNVGRPLGAFTTFAQGTDPTNPALPFKVYQRTYENALVLHKPVAYTRGVNGTIADNTATTHTLDGTYRKLNADGTLGPASRTVTLRNGEGAILVRA